MFVIFQLRAEMETFESLLLTHTRTMLIGFCVRSVYKYIINIIYFWIHHAVICIFIHDCFHTIILIYRLLIEACCHRNTYGSPLFGTRLAGGKVLMLQWMSIVLSLVFYKFLMVVWVQYLRDTLQLQMNQLFLSLDWLVYNKYWHSLYIMHSITIIYFHKTCVAI